MVFRPCRVSVHGWRGSDGDARPVFMLVLVYFPFIPYAEFPRKPTGALKEHLTTEADNRLGCYLPVPEPEQPPDPSLPPPPERPKLPADVVDAPLVRVYNFLRKCPASYHCKS